MSARKYLAELLGTFLFLTAGYLSVPAFIASGATNQLVVPFSFSLGLLAAIFAVGHISGGHFNPAVTIAMVIDKRTPTMDAVGYIIAQCIGAIGAAALVLVVSGQAAVAAGVTKPGGGVTDVGALIIEITLTAGFVAVILAVDEASPAARPPGDPVHADRDPLRLGPAVWCLGQSGPLARLRARRRRPVRAVDLHRRPGRGIGPRLGGLPRGRWRAGGRGRSGRRGRLRPSRRGRIIGRHGRRARRAVSPLRD